MKTEQVFGGLQLKEISDEGVFEGHGAVFGNIDLGGDIVARGAFRSSLSAARKAKRLPKFLLNHDPRTVAGIFEEMQEDDRGLFVKGRFNLDKQISREAFTDVKMGAVDGLSIGFISKKTARDETTGVRTIKEADLIEVSLVTFPMNEQARIGVVKSIAAQMNTIREFEEHLRDVGFSSVAAKAIAAGGFKTDLRDEAVDDETAAYIAVCDELQRLVL